MAGSQPFQVVEIDVDYCSRTYSQGLCGASLTSRINRTNVALRSEEFDDATWAKTLCSVTANVATSPNGLITADKFIPQAAAGSRSLQQTFASANLATVRTFSVFLKADGYSVYRLFMYNNAFSIAIGGQFTLSGAGTVTGTNVGSPLSSSRYIEDAGNGWYRCVISGAISATTETLRLLVTHETATDGVGGAFIWGAQLEDGLIASNYKKTTTTAVTDSWGGDTLKCFNTYATCTDQTVFDKGVKTLKYCNNRMNVPLGINAYPVLDSVSTFTSTVNIAGANESQGAFGRRGTVVARLKDLPDDDVLFDKYVRERTTGAAQADTIGYKPVDFGTHFTKLKARFPYYANRAMRVVDGVLENDVFVVEKTRHFIITNFKGPDDNGNFEIEGKDVLSLADDKKALVPKPSRGKLKTAITAAVGQTFDLDPAGIGVEYATSGYATIGSEVVTFTRVTDTITLTGRGLEGTVAAVRNINDAFQQSKHIDAVRVDDFVYDLLVNFAGVNPTFCPIVAKWEPLITRWMSSTRLTTTITKPTGVAQILGELAALGISIWWDDVQQQILILPNVPVTSESITSISDEYNIVNIKQDDREEDRLTQVHFYSKQTDPTKDVKDKSNYDQVQVIIDGTAEGPNAYDDTRVKEVFCRFFNVGAESAVRVAALRLLKRFNTAPIHYTIKLDNRDDALSLTDVLRINTRVLTSATGRTNQKLLQVFRKAETNAEGQFEVSAQAYNFDGRFGYCMPNGSAVYASATALEKATGNYAVGPTLLFPDGTVPYEAI